MLRPPALLAICAVLAVAAGCSSSSSPSTVHASATAPPSAGGAPAAAGTAPAVTGAANLQAQPTIAAGSGPAPTSLVVKDLVVGTGPVAATSNTVNVQYVGANYADGKVFDSSWQRGQAASFPLSQVIAGFAQGIAGMRVGGRRELVIPPALGYGPAGSGPVGPNETLVFVIDLLSLQ